ncbi:MAG: tetratricopeptide repeat protein, partial [Beijerinckiaceae bacterium]|nr:tetratricopeptide repeat protein [Beijerinckiaceae bacterium]
MSDFIREVDEDYRRERILGFLTRFQVPLAILVVAIIVGAGAWRFYKDRQTAAAEADNVRYAAAEALAAQGKPQEAEKAFEEIGRSGPAGYARLAKLRAAALLGASDPEA